MTLYDDLMAARSPSEGNDSNLDLNLDNIRAALDAYAASTSAFIKEARCLCAIHTTNPRYRFKTGIFIRYLTTDERIAFAKRSYGNAFHNHDILIAHCIDKDDGEVLFFTSSSPDWIVTK